VKVLLIAVVCAVAFAQRPDFEVRVVEDTSGNPLPSAEAKLQKFAARELAADLDTDREGIARASGLPPGEYNVTVVKSNYVSAQVRVRVPSERITVRLVHYGIISGQVMDSKGRPAQARIIAPGGRTAGGCRISILAKSDGPGGFTQLRETYLDEDARFRIYDLPPGHYAIGLYYDNLPDGSGMMIYPDTEHPRLFAIGGGEEHRGVDFTIPSRPAVQISGHVIQPKPKMRFFVALGSPGQPMLPIAETVAKDDGSFAFERVPAGTYDLFVSGPDTGYSMHGSSVGPDPHYARVRVNVGATNVSGIEVPVSGGKSVVVTLAGSKPPEGCPSSVNIHAKLLEPWGLLESGDRTSVTFGKEATLRGLVPGKVELTATGLTGNCYAANTPVVDLGGETPAPVALEIASAGSIRGTLRSGEAKPTDYTVVMLESDAQPTSEARIASPTADGRFAFDSLKPGRYRIAAQPNGPRARWVSDVSRMIEIDIPGGSPTDLDLPAPPKGAQQ
jgi:hypothetical protein